MAKNIFSLTVFGKSLQLTSSWLTYQAENLQLLLRNKLPYGTSDELQCFMCYVWMQDDIMEMQPNSGQHLLHGLTIFAALQFYPSSLASYIFLLRAKYHHLCNSNLWIWPLQILLLDWNLCMMLLNMLTNAFFTALHYTSTWLFECSSSKHAFEMECNAWLSALAAFVNHGTDYLIGTWCSYTLLMLINALLMLLSVMICPHACFFSSNLSIQAEKHTLTELL